jgi:hypothetical protein
VWNAAGSNTMQHGATHDSILCRSGLHAESKDLIPVCSLTDIQKLDIKRFRKLLLQMVLYGRHYNIIRYQCYWFCWFMVTVIQKCAFLGPLSFQPEAGWDRHGRYNFLMTLKTYPWLRSVLASFMGWLPTLESSPLWVLDMRFLFRNTLDLDHFIQEYSQRCEVPEQSRLLRRDTYRCIIAMQTQGTQFESIGHHILQKEVRELIQEEPADDSDIESFKSFDDDGRQDAIAGHQLEAAGISNDRLILSHPTPLSGLRPMHKEHDKPSEHEVRTQSQAFAKTSEGSNGIITTTTKGIHQTNTLTCISFRKCFTDHTYDIENTLFLPQKRTYGHLNLVLTK